VLLGCAAWPAAAEDRCRIGTYRAADSSPDEWRPGCPGFVPVQPGFFAVHQQRMPCAPGTYSQDPGSSACLPCDAGFVCPQAIDPVLRILRGATSPRHQPCGSAGVYCPAASGEATAVSTGYFSVGGSSVAAHTSQEICPSGHYCAGGVKHPCPAGRFGSREGLSSPACSGPCARGFYCPIGSTSPQQIPCTNPDTICPEGSKKPIPIPRGPATGPDALTARAEFARGDLRDADAAQGSPGISSPLVDSTRGVDPQTGAVEDESVLTASLRSSSELCSRGYVCLPGTGVRTPCPAGTFNDQEGVSTLEGCFNCSMGYTCSMASTTPTQHECGGTDVFCPVGSTTPTRVSSGYRTVGGGPKTRVAQVPCGPGAYCPGDGNSYLCPAGTFAAFPGHARCRPCAAGYYCDRGSRSATQHPCGNASLFCPPGSEQPLEGSPGFFTLRVEPTAILPQTVSLGTMSALVLPSPLEQEGFTTPPRHIPGTNTAMDVADPIRTTTVSRRLSTDQFHQLFWIMPPLAGFAEASEFTLAGDASLPQWAKLLGATAPQHLADTQAYLIEPSLQQGYSSGDLVIDSPTLLIPVGAPSAAQPARAILAGITEDTARFRTHQRLCDEGHFCPGDGTRVACPSGTYATQRGLSSSSQCAQCPAGHYCPEASTDPLPCASVDVFCPAGSSVPTAVSLGHYTTGGDPTTRSAQALCVPGFYCAGGILSPCPPGRYGSKTGESRSDCQGPCTAGFFCPQASFTPTHSVCGGPHVYCPQGSAEPVPARSGWYTVGGRTSRDVNGTTGFDDPLSCDRWTTMFSDATGEELPPGSALHGPMHPVRFDAARFCRSGVIGDPDTRTTQVPCEAGSFCVRGQRFECPPGRYGRQSASSDPQCDGECQAGFYCPWGSPRTDEHVCGGEDVFCPRQSGGPTPVSTGHLTDPSEPPLRRTREIPCPLGHYCERGIATKCPAGTYAGRLGESTRACSGPCAPGYWCGLGSVRATQNACGGTHVYCPLGSSAPVVAAKGSYTINVVPVLPGQDANNTRSGVAYCPVGHFCADGKLTQCPGGTFSNQTEQGVCPHECPAGYFCPPGSTEPLRCGQVFHNATLQDLLVRLDKNVSDLYAEYASVAANGNAVGLGAANGHLVQDRLAATALRADALLSLIPWESGARARLPRVHGDIRSTASEQSMPIVVGPSNAFCPKGAGWPSLVEGGWYTTGVAADDASPALNETRSGRHRCEPGFFCVAGIKHPCPPGTYGKDAGLVNRFCNGYCPPGHECPLATATPVECKDGWFASGGDHACMQCPDDSQLVDDDILRGLGVGLHATVGRGTELRARCKHSRECCEL
jgi:hypothetical protein